MAREAERKEKKREKNGVGDRVVAQVKILAGPGSVQLGKDNFNEKR